MDTRVARITTPELIAVGLFIIFTVWWLYLYFFHDLTLTQHNLYWAALYQTVAIWGGLFGLISSRRWGGYRSLMGQAIIFFSVGLLFQSLGQTVFSYYTTLRGVDLPYPSLADVGYFGSVILYILGIWCLARVAGVGTSLRNLDSKLFTLLVPFLALIASYGLFLRGYVFDWSAPLRVILDFGYPLGEAIYVSIAALTLMLSWNLLRGIMRWPLVFVMIALIAQYIAEFNFLYQALNETWINGGYGDFLYLLAYFLMALSLALIYKTIDAHRT